jgi:hypothetical protein
VVDKFADEEVAAMQHAIQSVHRDKLWVCDVARLREGLEVTYVALFEDARLSLKRIEQGLYPHLERVVTSLLPDYQGEPIEAPAESRQVYPSAAPLSDFVTMDLSQPWWKIWFAGRPNPQERSKHLRALIEHDFLEVIGKLVEEARRQLNARIDHTMKKIQAVVSSLLAATGHRGQSAWIDQLGSDCVNAERFEQVELERKQRRAVSAKRLANFVTTGNELRALLRKLDLMWIENSGA